MMCLRGFCGEKPGGGTRRGLRGRAASTSLEVWDVNQILMNFHGIVTEAPTICSTIDGSRGWGFCERGSPSGDISARLARSNVEILHSCSRGCATIIPLSIILESKH